MPFGLDKLTLLMARKALTELMSARQWVESRIRRFVPVASRQCLLLNGNRFDILRADARLDEGMVHHPQQRLEKRITRPETSVLRAYQLGPKIRKPPCRNLRDRDRNVRSTSILLKNPLLWRQHLGFGALSARQIPASAPHVAKIGAGSGMSFASFRRFWAVAAKRNSSLAPFGPRRRNRPSLRMRFR